MFIHRNEGIITCGLEHDNTYPIQSSAKVPRFFLLLGAPPLYALWDSGSYGPLLGLPSGRLLNREAGIHDGKSQPVLAAALCIHLRALVYINCNDNKLLR